MRKNALQTIAVVVAMLMIGVGIFGFLTLYQNHLLNSKVATLQSQIASLEGTQSSIATATKNAVAQISAAANKSSNPVQTQTVAAKSQDQLITSAVAKEAPAVVSIVISQYAPQYQISYENPFGDDPRFGNIRIPVYKQVGQTLQKVGAGTGILFTHDGYIVTNKHVIFDPNAQYKVLLSDGSEKIAEVVYTDPKNDIAIIKINGNYNSIASLGDSSNLKLGQTVAAIGNALGEYNNSVSVGIISGLDRSITAADESGTLETLRGVIQTDAAINPGNSGGPLLDLNGNIVGINVATDQGANSIGFAIPINTVKSILSNYK